MAYSYSIDDPAKNSKRMAAFTLVVIIHVLFVWVLASGLGKKVVEVVMGPVETRLIEELPDEEDEPPPSTQGRGARITQPEYPPASRRAGEEGTVQLQVFVLDSGRAGEVKVARSSGFPKLDEAAINEVKRNWRFVPGKEDGKPTSMWHTFAVTFRLTD